MATLPEKTRLLSSALIFLMLTSFSSSSLTQSRSQNRQFQRAVRSDKTIFVLEGVRERALNSVKPDPILLINFPEIDHQFKVSNHRPCNGFVTCFIVLVPNADSHGREHKRLKVRNSPCRGNLERRHRDKGVKRLR